MINKSDVMEAKNIPSQINFFKDQFMPNSISDSYTLAINLNEPNSVTDTSNIINLKGTFSNFEITAEASSPTIYLCSVTFMEGSVQTITNNNSPFRVRDLEVTRNIDNDTLDITWNAPLNFGNSTIKSYVLVYYESGSSEPSINVTEHKYIVGDEASVSLSIFLVISKLENVPFTFLLSL